jgi:hypothetical protein
VRIDFDALVIEKDIPLIEAWSRPSAWDQILAKMVAGDSVQFPEAARDAASHAQAKYRQRVDPTAKFTIRKVSEAHVRLWRTA